METEEMVIQYLQSEEYREGKYTPKEFFFITSGIFKLFESLENAEINIRLGIIEAEIISFCMQNADNLFLQSYIDGLRNLLMSDFSLEKLKQCETLFKRMRDIYMRKYANIVTLTEA